MNTLIKTMVVMTVLSWPLAGMAGMEGIMEGHHAHRLEHLTKELNLSPEQQQKLKAIFQEEHEKFRALREEHDQKLSAVLTAEQNAKFQALKEQHKKHWLEKHAMPAAKP